jgi:hypothetical protein
LLAGAPVVAETNFKLDKKGDSIGDSNIVPNDL